MAFKMRKPNPKGLADSAVFQMKSPMKHDPVPEHEHPHPDPLPEPPIQMRSAFRQELTDEQILDGYRQARAAYFNGDESAKADIDKYYNLAGERNLDVTEVERESQTEWAKEEGKPAGEFDEEGVWRGYGYKDIFLKK